MGIRYKLKQHRYNPISPQSTIKKGLTRVNIKFLESLGYTVAETIYHGIR